MILLLERGTPPKERDALIQSLHGLGLEGRALGDGELPMIHVVAGPTRRAKRLLALPRVVALVPTSGPRIRREGRRFYPYHFIGRSAAALGLVGALVFLAGFLPPGVGDDLDPRAAPDGGELALPWILWPARGLARLGPQGSGWVAWLLALAGLALLLALPLLARGTRRGLAGHALGLLAGLALAAAAVLLGIQGAAA